jgi:hypothetical protein
VTSLLERAILSYCAFFCRFYISIACCFFMIFLYFNPLVNTHIIFAIWGYLPHFSGHLSFSSFNSNKTTLLSCTFILNLEIESIDFSIFLFVQTFPDRISSKSCWELFISILSYYFEGIKPLSYAQYSLTILYQYISYLFLISFALELIWLS